MGKIWGVLEGVAAIWLRGNPRKGWESGGLYIAQVAGSLQKHPRFFSRARGAHVSDRRGSAVPPIRVKLRTARSARRAGGVHLALEPFREHFPARYKNNLFNY